MHDQLTVEHVIPKWARRTFDIKGPVTVHASAEGQRERRQVGRIQALNITLDNAICEECNNVWLGGLELAVKPFLAPMAASARPTALAPGMQRLAATWAVKTALLLELALRQMYPGSRAIEGYEASRAELAWLRDHSEPPPRSFVWLGSWDCKQATPLRYAPSSAAVGDVVGQFTTFALGFAAFQVFTVDFEAADRHHARDWNPDVPPALAGALQRIWPPRPEQDAISWPAQSFAEPDWDRLVAWDGALRSGKEPLAGHPAG